MGANVAEKYGGMQEKVWVPLPGGVFCRNFYMGSCINLQGVGGVKTKWWCRVSNTRCSGRRSPFLFFGVVGVVVYLGVGLSGRLPGSEPAICTDKKKPRRSAWAKHT